MKNFVSLFDVEQARQDKEEKLQFMKLFLGRDTHLPAKLKGHIITTGETHPLEVLIHAGYKPNGTNGWVRRCDDTHRFHAYIIPDKNEIYLHTDLIKGRFHLAGEYRFGQEKKRLKKYRTKKITPLSDGSIPLRMNVSKKKDTLPMKTAKELIKAVQEQNRANFRD